MERQHTLMKFDPATGDPKPYPSHAAQWREWHGSAAWLYDPWTPGEAARPRLPSDIGSDPFGLAIVPNGEEAANAAPAPAMVLVQEIAKLKRDAVTDAAALAAARRENDMLASTVGRLVREVEALQGQLDAARKDAGAQIANRDKLVDQLQSQVARQSERISSLRATVADFAQRLTKIHDAAHVPGMNGDDGK